MNPLFILLGLTALAASRKRSTAAPSGTNGPGVRYVPTGSPVGGRMPAATVPTKPAAAPKPAAAQPPAASARPQASATVPTKPAAAPKPAAAQPPAASARPQASPQASAPKPATKLTIAPAPGSPTPSPDEQAMVEKAVQKGVAEHLAKEAAAQAPAGGGRSKKQAAQDLAEFLKRSGRFGSSSDRVPEVQDAQRDLGVTPDGVVGPVTRAAATKQGVNLPAKPAPARAPTRAPTKPTAARPRAVRPAPAAPATRVTTKRSPQEAAHDLADFLARTSRFGSRSDRPNEVKLAQRDLGVTPDGIVGAKTRSAAARAGVQLPQH